MALEMSPKTKVKLCLRILIQNDDNGTVRKHADEPSQTLPGVLSIILVDVQQIVVYN